MGRHRPKKGRSAKRARAATVNADDEYANYPHSFIFNENVVGRNVSQLIMDVRKVMEPFTASKLKARKNNELKDFVDVGMTLGVSHLMMFSKSETEIHLKIGRLPQGPTLTFKVLSYALAKDIINSLKKHHMEAKQFLHHPLLVMNNFGRDALKHKLISSMLQNMFPSIHIDRAKLNDYKRCVVFNYNEESDTIEFRHYNINIAPVGLSRPVKKLLKNKIPDMSRYTEISDFLLNTGNLSESEAEVDGPLNEVVLPQFVSGRGNIESSKSAVRLTEIGPRFTLSLLQILEGLCEGEVLFGPKLEEKTKKRKKNGEKNSREKKKRKTDAEAKSNDEDDDNDGDDDDDGDDEKEDADDDGDDEEEDADDDGDDEEEDADSDGEDEDNDATANAGGSESEDDDDSDVESDDGALEDD